MQNTPESGESLFQPSRGGTLDVGGTEDETRPAVRGALSPDLQGLSESSRRIWADPAERSRIVGALLNAETVGDIDRVRRGIAQLDHAVTEALDRLGLSRGLVTGPFAVRTDDFAGIKRAECTLEIRTTSMRAYFASERGPDTTLRTWVHESIHGRQPYASGHAAQYRSWSGYEEGLAEGLARIVVRGRAGLDPLQPNYNFPVSVYETLSEATGIDDEDLLRALWRQPAGRVRGALVDAVDAGRRIRSLPSFSANQRGAIVETADYLFASANSGRAPNGRVILTLWQGRLR